MQHSPYSGRDSYIKNGGKLGRKPGSVKTSEQKREEYKEVISLLRKGYAIRNVAKLSGVSVSTVQRIKESLLFDYELYFVYLRQIEQDEKNIYNRLVVGISIRHNCILRF